MENMHDLKKLVVIGGVMMIRKLARCNQTCESEPIRRLYGGPTRIQKGVST